MTHSLTYMKRWERRRCRKVAQGPSLSALNSVCTLLHTLLSCVRFKMLYTYCSSAQLCPLQIAVHIYCSIYTAAGSAPHILHSFHLQCAVHTYFTAENCFTGWLMIFPRHLLQKHNTFETPFCSMIILTLGWQCFWMKIRQLGKIRHEDGAALFQCRLSAWCMQFIQITIFVLLSLNLY